MKLTHILFLTFSLLAATTSANGQDTPCGLIWGPITRLTSPEATGISPRIATQGETLHVTWNFSGGERLPYARSTDGGISWEPTRELLPDSITYTRPAHDPWIFTTATDVVLLFIGASGDGVTPIMIVRSSDAGTNWTSPEPITADSGTRIY